MAGTGKTKYRYLGIIAAIAIALPAQARQDSPQKPINDGDPDVEDIARTPVTDLNLDPQKIPPLLTAAMQKPYDLTGIKSCEDITAAVLELYKWIGPDIDLPPEERAALSPGRLAKWFVGSFIPFRGLIREISGANAHNREVLAAIRAGVARRGFLKGVGQSRQCAYPASPATPAIIQAYSLKMHLDEHKGKNSKAAAFATSSAGSSDPDEEPANREKGTKAKAGLTFTSAPVVQRTP